MIRAKMYRKKPSDGNWLGGLAKAYQELNVYLGLGVQLAVTIVVMFFLGRYLDEKMETAPLLTIMFAFFGGFAGTYNFIKAVTDLNKKRSSQTKTDEKHDN